MSKRNSPKPDQVESFGEQQVLPLRMLSSKEIKKKRRGKEPTAVTGWTRPWFEGKRRGKEPKAGVALGLSLLDR